MSRQAKGKAWEEDESVTLLSQSADEAGSKLQDYGQAGAVQRRQTDNDKQCVGPPRFFRAMCSARDDLAC